MNVVIGVDVLVAIGAIGVFWLCLTGVWLAHHALHEFDAWVQRRFGSPEGPEKEVE